MDELQKMEEAWAPIQQAWKDSGKPNPWEVSRALYDQIFELTPPLLRFVKNDGTENLSPFPSGIVIRPNA